jgi:DNA-binding XRE family transcriptional regulator
VTSIELKKWREKHSLTQNQLGRLLGVTKTCVYRWEAGFRHIPSFLHLALKWLELEGGETKAKGKKNKGGEKVNGNDLQKRKYLLD